MAFALVMRPIGAPDLLLYLLRNGRTMNTKIIEDMGLSTDTFYDARNKLIDLGYAYPEEESGRPRHAYTGLTRAGEATAQLLVPAEALFRGTLEVWNEELFTLEKADDPSTLARRVEILRLLGDRAFSLGRWKESREFAEKLVRLAARAEDKRAEAEAHLLIGKIAQKQDHHGDALAALVPVLPLADAAQAYDLASEAEYVAGSSLERQTKLAEALERYASAREHAERAHDALRLARAREGYARVLAQQGHFEEALANYKAVIGEFQKVGIGEDLARAYGGLGATAYTADQPDALSWFEKGIEAARREASVRMEAYGCLNAAAPLTAAEDYPKADTYLRRAREVFKDLVERRGSGAVELAFANLRAAQRRWPEAEHAFDEAMRIAREIGNRPMEASVQFNRGQMMKRRNEREAARTLLTEARRLFVELGNAARVARCDQELQDLTA